eukprot:Opistho-2@60485
MTVASSHVERTSSFDTPVYDHILSPDTIGSPHLWNKNAVHSMNNSNANNRANNNQLHPADNPARANSAHPAVNTNGWTGSLAPPGMDSRGDSVNRVRSVLTTALHPEPIPAQPIGAKGKARLAFEALRQESGFFLRKGFGANDVKGENGLIHPKSKFRLVWDVCCILLVLYTLIILPVHVAFYFDGATFGLFVFNSLVDFFFVADIIIIFFTGISDDLNRRIIWDRRTVAMRYVRGWFAIDLISTLPLDIIIEPFGGGDSAETVGNMPTAVRVIKLLYLVKILRVFRLGRYSRRWTHWFHITATVLRLFKFGMALFLFLHWEACIWVSECVSICMRVRLPFWHNIGYV